MITPEVGDKTLSVPAQSVDGKQIPISVPIGTPQVGDTVTLIPTAGDSVKYTAAVTTTPAVGDTVAVVPLQGGDAIKWAAVNGGDKTPVPAYRGKIGLGYRPSCICVDEYGDFYVTDPDHALVWKYDHTGKFLLKWGSFGSGDGQFNFPQGIASGPAGEIYVVDTYNSRIQKFTSTGQFITKWGSFGTYVYPTEAGPYNFDFPFGVTVTPTGDIWVTDTNNYRVKGFSSEGVSIGNFKAGNDVRWYGIGSTNPGDHLTAPWGVVSDANGNLWVGDYGGIRNDADTHIKLHLRPSWVFPVEFAIEGGGPDQVYFPSGLVLGQEYLYVVEHSNHRVHQFTLAGANVATFGGLGSDVGQFNSPTGIAIDTAGNMYVTDTENQRIVKYAAGGTGWGTLPTKDMTYPLPMCIYRIGNIQVENLAAALVNIPSDVWEFSYASTAAPGTDWSPEPNYGGLPWPVRDYALCIGSVLQFAGMQSVGLGDPHRASVLMLATESVADLTQRIWHELLHGVVGIESPDTMHSSTGFITWMTANHPGHPFLADPIHYLDTTEVLLWWDEYLTGTIPGISKT